MTTDTILAIMNRHNPHGTAALQGGNLPTTERFAVHLYQLTSMLVASEGIYLPDLNPNKISEEGEAALQEVHVAVMAEGERRLAVKLLLSKAIDNLNKQLSQALGSKNPNGKAIDRLGAEIGEKQVELRAALDHYTIFKLQEVLTRAMLYGYKEQTLDGWLWAYIMVARVEPAITNGNSPVHSFLRTAYEKRR